MLNYLFRVSEAAAVRALCQDNLDELKVTYKQLHRTETASQEADAIFDALDSPLANGDECFAKMEEAKTASPPNPKLHGASLVISATYTFESMYAADQGNMVAAWRALTEARYWCGSYTTNPGLQEARRRTIDETHKKIPRSGGHGRAEKLYGPWKDIVYRFAKELCPDGGWRSWSSAANAISLELDLQHELSVPDAPAPTHKTMCGWLSVMPDGAKLFPTRTQKT